MELFMSYILPFGNVTVTVLGLLVLALVLAGVYQLGILIISVTLAFDCDDAPDFKMENKVWPVIKWIIGEWRVVGCYSQELKVYDSKLLHVFGTTMMLDTLLLCLYYQFFYTTLFLAIATLVYGVRTLAKKVYKNTKKIKVHEGRIVKLEGDE